jgi:selenoprotein W-related protein
MKPTIEIEYCTGCRWLLRAAWIAQELLTTFESELAAVSLQPSATAGTFQVRSAQLLLWDRRKEGRFPEMKELKQRVRDHIAPGRDLGHSDRQGDGAPDGGQ